VPDTADSASFLTKPRRLDTGGLLYLLLFAGLFILYLLISPYVTLDGSPGQPVSVAVPYIGDAGVRLGMAVCLLLLALAAAALLLLRKMTVGKALALLLLAGVVLRFGVMLTTPFFVHGHDVGDYGGYGHLDYIVRLFDNGRLPATNLGQLYHPPLAHAAAAAVARLFSLITGAADRNAIFEAARLAPCFFSCASMLVSLRLFEALGLSKKATLLALTAVAFHPTFFLLAPSINNDMAMVFFFLTAVLYTVRWYKDPTYKNILLLALSIGAAMSSKFSGALVAFFTAVVFVLGFARQWLDTGGLKGRAPGLMGQFAAFAAVCFPLGLWYPIRNLKLFGQPLGYVLEIPKESSLYVGHIPFAERFLAFDPVSLLWGGYCRPWEDYRLPQYTVKCALFGEYTFPDSHSLVAVILIAASLVLILLSLLAMVWFLIRHQNRLAVYSMAAVWGLQAASFVFFNIRYPFGCTMDFRYIVPTVVTGAVFLGLLFDRLGASPRSKPLAAALVIVLAVFAVSAAVFYIM
jgi:hypothetical protein